MEPNDQQEEVVDDGSQLDLSSSSIEEYTVLQHTEEEIRRLYTEEDCYFDSSSCSPCIEPEPPERNPDEIGSDQSWDLECDFDDFEGADKLSDDEFRKNYRLNRSTFDFLLELLKNQLSEPLMGLDGRPMHHASDNNPEKLLMFALARMTMPRPDRNIRVEVCGISKTTGWRSIRKVVNALNSHIHTFIRWPDQARATEISNYFERTHGLPKIIGAISHMTAYTVLPTRWFIMPPVKLPMDFRIISDHNSLITHVITGKIEPIRDLRVLRRSGFKNVFSKEKGDYFVDDDLLVGDEYTRLIKSSPVSRLTLDLLRKRFASLTDVLPERRINIEMYINACCILHNICEMHNDRMRDEDEDHELNLNSNTFLRERE